MSTAGRARRLSTAVRVASTCSRFIDDARAVVIVDAVDLGLAAGAVATSSGATPSSALPPLVAPSPGGGVTAPRPRDRAASAISSISPGSLMGTPPATGGLARRCPARGEIAVGTDLTEVVQRALAGRGPGDDTQRAPQARRDGPAIGAGSHPPRPRKRQEPRT